MAHDWLQHTLIVASSEQDTNTLERKKRKSHTHTHTHTHTQKGIVRKRCEEGKEQKRKEGVPICGVKDYSGDCSTMT